MDISDLFGLSFISCTIMKSCMAVNGMQSGPFANHGNHVHAELLTKCLTVVWNAEKYAGLVANIWQISRGLSFDLPVTFQQFKLCLAANALLCTRIISGSHEQTGVTSDVIVT